MISGLYVCGDCTEPFRLLIPYESRVYGKNEGSEGDRPGVSCPGRCVLPNTRSPTMARQRTTDRREGSIRMRHSVYALVLALALLAMAIRPARGADEMIETPQRCSVFTTQGLPALHDALSPWDAGPSADVYLVCLGSAF